MTRPIALLLRDIRVRSRKTQKEFAQELGFEQAEISAFELGTRKPTDALLSKLADLIGLSAEDKVEMQEALEESEHRFTLPVDATTETYRFCNALWGRIDRLHPAILEAMHSILLIEEQFASRTRLPPKRLRRRQHKETNM
jgi:transcriptional regulator with XRE-family HTH domain